MNELLGQFIFAIPISIIGFCFWLGYKPWFKLAKAFGTKLVSLEIFLKEQTCKLDHAYLKGCVGVGIAEQKLYLSHTSPLSYFIQPLLIDLDAIAKIKPCFESLLHESYKFFIGNPNITTLVLARDLINYIWLLFSLVKPLDTVLVAIRANSIM